MSPAPNPPPGAHVLSLDRVVDLDDGVASRAALGLLALQSDEVVESELGQLLSGPGVGLYVSRVPSGEHVTEHTLSAMADAITPATALLPPTVSLSVVAYACTSGAAVLGARQVAAAVQRARPEARATDPLSAVLAALDALGVRRVAFVSPYLPEVSARLVTALEAGGLHISSAASFAQSEERVVARITPAALAEAARVVARRAPCDAVFLSCTNLRLLPVVAAVEAELGVPVLSSNLALAWHMRELAGIPTPNAPPIALFSRARLSEATG